MELIISIQQTAALLILLIALTAWVDRESKFMNKFNNTKIALVIIFSGNFLALIFTTLVRIWF